MALGADQDSAPAGPFVDRQAKREDTTMTQRIAGPGRPGASSEPTATLTRVLLACGAIGAPLFLLVFHLDMLTRPGYDLLRHGPSQLMTGDRGWLQIANFVVTGLLMLACAVGLRRALAPGPGSTWGPLLMGAYGLGMICTGIFVTDPQKGYPPGTPNDAIPDVTVAASWHENLHTLSVAVTYTALTAACFVLARRLAAEPGGRWWAVALIATGVAAPAVLLVGTMILPGLISDRETADWYFRVDGVLGRVVIPLGWIWAALVPIRLLGMLARTQATPLATGGRAVGQRHGIRRGPQTGGDATDPGRRPA
jgi:Protein of unknown function (DUF998)